MSYQQIEMPYFTAEQFKNSSAPYEWLYARRENKFVLQQLVQRMKDMAGSVGVLCFMSLWNAFCESMKRQQGEPIGNVTAFDGQPLELVSGNYVCSDENGVVMLDKFGYEVNVCRHPILPVERLVNADTGEERLRLAYRKGRVWRSLIVEKSVLASSTGILSLAANGVLVNSENAKALSTYLLEVENLNLEAIPEQQSIGRLGWISGDRFSPYEEGLSFDGEANFKGIYNAVHESGSREKWIEAMRSLRKEKALGRFFLASSFASVILQPCGLLPFFLHCFGETGNGKTVGLMIAASVWADPSMGAYITTFNSTAVGQEVVATFLNSLPMCIDELQIQASAGIRDFDRIIYQLTEGIGKARGTKSGGLQRLNTWRNCFISTGEHPISNVSSGGGAVNRIIEFECSEKIYSDLKGLCDVLSVNYGHVGKELVQYVLEYKEEVIAIQKGFYEQLIKVDSTDKQAASASAILTADKIATDLFFKDGNNLTVEELASIMAKKDDVNANARTYSYILELVARNHSRFLPNEVGTGEVWGKIEGGYIYIIKSVFDRELKNEGFSSSAFLPWANRRGLILSDNGRHRKNVRILGNLVPCVCIKKEPPNENEKTYEELAQSEDLFSLAE